VGLPGRSDLRSRAVLPGRRDLPDLPPQPDLRRQSLRWLLPIHSARPVPPLPPGPAAPRVLRGRWLPLPQERRRVPWRLQVQQVPRTRSLRSALEILRGRSGRRDRPDLPNRSLRPHPELRDPQTRRPGRWSRSPSRTALPGSPRASSAVAPTAGTAPTCGRGGSTPWRGAWSRPASARRRRRPWPRPRSPARRAQGRGRQGAPSTDAASILPRSARVQSLSGARHPPL